MSINTETVIKNASLSYQEGKYSQAILLYEAALSITSVLSRSQYWELGLCYLMSGNQQKAFSTWEIPFLEAPLYEAESLTKELVDFLDEVADQFYNNSQYEPALKIRETIQEIVADIHLNLVKTDILRLALHKGTSKEIILSTIDLIDRKQNLNAIDTQIINDLIIKALHCPSKFSLGLVYQLCNTYSNYLQFALDNIPQAISQFPCNPDAVKLLVDLGNSLSPNAMRFDLLLISTMFSAKRYQDGLQLAYACYERAKQKELTYQSLVLEVLVYGAIFACRPWQEIEALYQANNACWENLIKSYDVTFTNQFVTIQMVTACFHNPYFADNPKSHYSLRLAVHQAAYREISKLYPDAIVSFRKRLALRNKHYDPNLPVRLGFVCRYLCSHAVGYLARWLVQYLDRSKFQLYAYMGGDPDKIEGDPLRSWYISQFDKAYDKDFETPEKMAQAIIDDGIDILLDLDSITTPYIGCVSALKPAPVIATWLGWDAGAFDNIDYFIADPYVLPESAESLYVEKIWRLPHTFIAVDGFEVDPPTVDRPSLGIPDDAIVYYTAQSPAKRHPQITRLQMEVLRRVPNSYLLIKSQGADQEGLKRLLQSYAVEAEIPVERLKFLAPSLTPEKHRGNFLIADIILDTYPYSGASHTIEALWLGIPVVTRVGEQFSARNSYSMLVNAGVTEGIAWTDEEYIDWAVRLGTDQNLRQQVVWKLLQGKHSAPLWNSKAFTKEMEKAFYEMRERYLQSSTYSDIHIDPEIDREVWTAEAKVLFDRGLYYARKDNLSKAIVYWQKAVEWYPEYIDALYNLGTAYHKLRRYQEAVSYFEKIISIDPKHISALYNLGLTLVEQSRFEVAINVYKQVLSIDPNDTDTYIGLGFAYFMMQEWEEAENAYKRVLDINPKSTSALVGLGATLIRKEQIQEAVSYLEQAIAIDANDAHAYGCLGLAFTIDQQLDEAVACYRRAIELLPKDSDAYWDLNTYIASNTSHPLSSNFAFQRYLGEQCFLNCQQTDYLRSRILYIDNYNHSGVMDLAIDKFKEVEAYIEEYQENLSFKDLQALYSTFLFHLFGLRDDLAGNLGLAKLIGHGYRKNVIRVPAIDRCVVHTPSGEKLRLGILSPHFNRHPVAFCSLDIVKELSQLTPHIYLYSASDVKRDALTAKFEEIVADYSWRNMDQTNEYVPRIYKQEMIEKIANKILADKIDVLIDLDSITTPLNTHILCRRPAPVCLSWLGFDAPFVCAENYFLGDYYTHPEGVDQYYVERIIRLPNSHVAIAGFELAPIDRVEKRRELAIEPDQVAYLYAAPGRKFNRATAKASVEILKRVPNAILFHKGKGDQQLIMGIYHEECELQGVDQQRVRYLPPFKTEEEHRGMYKVFDVFLDAYPYNGGTHNIEALWSNLPVVTHTGQQSFARMGYSFIKSAGVDTGIGFSWEEYIEWGVKYGIDTNLRLSVQEKLQRGKDPANLAPLWNPKQLAENMYQIFQQLLATL
ncbi:MAG: tetratricopeptide repeat protein [Pseudanabaenaceae cyanobacterium]